MGVGHEARKGTTREEKTVKEGIEGDRTNLTVKAKRGLLGGT